jgi:hypothetical protein
MPSRIVVILASYYHSILPPQFYFLCVQTYHVCARRMPLISVFLSSTKLCLNRVVAPGVVIVPSFIVHHPIVTSLSVHFLFLLS